MLKKYLTSFTLITTLFIVIGCKSSVKQQEDELYSRHLQRHVKLTIISTPMPDEKAELNLLLLNDGQDMDQLRAKEIMDSLYRKKLIRPLLIVGIHAGERIKEYGVAGYPDYVNHGDKAEYYDAFINNELYPFAKKKASVRKFNSVAIAGCSLGGLSAFDIAWTHADKIDKVGVFSGSFKWSDKSTENPDYSDNTDRIMLNKIRSSRKKPGLKYWFYGDDENEKGMRYHDSIAINHTKDLVELIKSKNVCLPGDIMYIEDTDGKQGYTSWSKAFPAFLIWAFGK
jgi:predicted alpha/beta superfamily hydrolase